MVVEDTRFGYKVLVGQDRTEMRVCFNDTVFNSSNWTPDPIATTVPTLYTQMGIQLGLSGVIYFLLKPLNQSRLVAEVIAGFLIGPSCFGNLERIVDQIFPFVSNSVLEHTMSIGIVYYMFQLGLEMNLTPMLKIGRKTTTIAIIGMIVPMAVGFGSYFLVIPPLKPGDSVLAKLKSAFVWAIALTATNLPDLTRVLADQKLMRTDIGRTAIASSFVNDIATWLFIVILISISRPNYVLRMCISTLILVLFSAFLARPALSWLVSRTSKGKDYNEFYIQFVLCGVLVSAFFTDALGLGSFVGAFMFGFSLPSGQLTTIISERIEKVGSWFMVPLYCLVTGIKSNVLMMVPQDRSAKHVILFMAVSWAAKVVSSFLVSLKPNMRRPQEVFTLGVLMNSKGLLALIAINTGRELYLVDFEASTIMTLTILLMMISVPPIVKYTYKPQRRMMLHKARTVQSTGSDFPFRILACIHSKHQVQGVTSLLRMSNPTAQSRICVVGVQLVELTEHTSAAMLIVHDTYRFQGSQQHGVKSDSDQIIESMEAFGRENSPLISVECLTAISRYATMHVDICSIAEDKRAALIIIPFHEQANSRGDEPESIDYHSMRNMNQQVLLNAPCTVGLLVDRGLGKPNYGASCLVMFYVGGADDREALSYAWRMVWRANVHLTVVRLVQGANAVESTVSDDLEEGKGILNLLENNERQKELDEEFITEFKSKTISNQSVSYMEEVVNGGEETMAVITNVMSKSSFHLCIVGRGNKRISPIESGLSDLVEFQELGTIGDAIVTSDFSMSTSVLIIQHYSGSTHRQRGEPAM